METKKKCRACLEEKELCEFYNLKSSKDGKDYKCIKCQKEGKKSFVEDIQGYKDCKACGLNKKLTDFSKAIENCDGRRGKCKKCVKDKVSIPTEILEVKEGFKICTSCKEELEISCFIKDKYRPDGLAGNCKFCRKKNQEKIKNSEKNIPPVKKCNRCELIKDEKEFNRNSNSYSGLDSACKSCRTEEYHEIWKDKVYIELEYKTCSICNIEKEIKEFNKRVNSPDNHTLECKSCISIIRKSDYLKDPEKKKKSSKIYRDENPELLKIKRKIWYDNNREKSLEKSKKYRENNKAKLSEQNKKWREDNKEYIKAKKKEYSQNNRHIQKAWLDKRKAEDPLFKMAVQIRVNFNNIFNKILDNKLVKNKSSSEILCCSFEDFFSHIEKQFLSWMTFNNHGLCKEDLFNCSWHFDHIIPVSEATTEEEVYLLNHWSNFQPMCGKRNLSKNNKFYPCTNLELGITFWKDNWVYLKGNDKKGF